jgi:hypothetical protein
VTVAPLAYFNVKDYGATGNGTTDDTAAIQAALNAAPAGSIILFPAGTYSVASSLAVHTNTKVVGQWNPTINMTGAWTGTTGCFTVDSGATNVAFEGFTINCQKASKAGTTNSRGIWIPNATTVRVNNVTVIDPGNGGIDVAAGSDIGVTNCRITGGGNGTTAARSHGIGFSGNTAPLLTNCWATHNVLIGPMDTGIGLYTGVANCTVANNVLNNCGINGGGHSIDCPGAWTSTITGNVIQMGSDAANSSTVGINLINQFAAQGINDITVTGNTIIGPGGPSAQGINISGDTTGVVITQRLLIANNICTGMSAGGIQCGQANGAFFREITIQGNVCEGNTLDGISISGAGGVGGTQGLIVANNVCSVNSRYGINFGNSTSLSPNCTVTGNGGRGNTSGGFGSVPTALRTGIIMVNNQLDGGNAWWQVIGVPPVGTGSNGDFAFRSDGTTAAHTILYHKEAGAWVATSA